MLICCISKQKHKDKHPWKSTCTQKYFVIEIIELTFSNMDSKTATPGYLLHIVEFHLEIGNLMENYDEFSILHCFLRPP